MATMSLPDCLGFNFTCACLLRPSLGRSALVAKGVAFHHGKLEASDRLKVEDLFRHGLLAAVASTSTLALGVSRGTLAPGRALLSSPSPSLTRCAETAKRAPQVNLPAHCVVLLNTVQYNGQGLQELSESQVLQMIGRAGRPGFDTQAVAIILTSSENEAKYRGIISGARPLESRQVCGCNVRVAHLGDCFAKLSVLSWFSFIPGCTSTFRSI